MTSDRGQMTTMSAAMKVDGGARRRWSLRSCEPEFLVSTPERLLELVSLKAIDISGVSLLVSTFEVFTSFAQNILSGPVTRLCQSDVVTCQSAFISQLVHFHTTQEEKVAKYSLRSCEPEFLVSTPERLLELVSLKAIDISGVSLLVSTFEVFTSFAQNILSGPVTRLCQSDVVTCQSAFISQLVHFHTTQEEKVAKIKQIITRIFSNEVPIPDKILLISRTANKFQMLISSLKEGYEISEDSSCAFSIISNRKALRVFATDCESLHEEDLEEFGTIIFMDLPTSIEDYLHVLTTMARHSITGALHSFFCKGDAARAQPIVEILMQCESSKWLYLAIEKSPLSTRIRLSTRGRLL
ncbi:hypothetical protein C4D60_Mb06t17610 [Musa balbisiana]|uniref:Uncharacterized protein n=1 Tax=Musa balbisiana TaxID=52838 RepID=A0A4S8INX8_MUSBA|nr:hypothetical protein C4D60_Mb06t17610 [Musa balbisiana]